MQLKRTVGLLLVSLALLVPVAGCDPNSGNTHGVRRDAGRGGDGATGPMLPDADNDGIPDQYEGRSSMTDTDGDGTQDYLDNDSDGDGIEDAVEGGNPNGIPRDADHDGTPDFQDLDSDGNGITDHDEGAADPDGDGIADADDVDNDGDRINDTDELGPDPTMPRDVDADGTADWYDLDSDNDNISDGDESVTETDGDGTPDRYDQDSDNDGLTDTMEAGDTDPASPPIDTDGDHVFDFRDTDSDNDGLADSAELAAGSSPTTADTDGDGVSDLIEVASMTNPLDMTDSPRTHGNFVFVEPYMMPPSPMRDTLDFATNIRSADVYFLMDTTGSMGASINSLASGIATPTSGLIDRVRTMISDVYFGVGEFKDAGDVPALYRNVQDLAMDPTASRTAAGSLSPGGGGDGPEGDVPALWATATGMSPGFSVPVRTGCPAGTFGYPCFRSGAVPIIVLITDWSFHNDRAGNDPSGYTNYTSMLAAISDANIRVIGIAQQTSGDFGALPDLRDIAADSGATDGAGAPLVSVYSGGSISDAVVNQIATLAQQTRFDISTNYVDNPGDSVDTRTAFVDHIEANTAGDAARGCAARAAVDTNGDGILDTFQGVTAGQRVCFDIIVRQNDTVMPTAMPQLFDANIQVIGDGFTVLDSRTVYFLVPPVVPPAGPS